MQTRCKFCVDGTGNDSDISVGDFWEADSDGFPTFEEGDGNSVIIARSEKGRRLILDAAADGVIELSAVDLELVAAMQPLQVSRRKTLMGRLAARRLLGRPGPSYRGFRLGWLAARSPKANLRAFVGAIKRSRRPTNPTDW